MRPEPVLLGWSGGKDSAMTLHALQQDPSVRVTGLLTTVTRGYERVSMHGVRTALVEAQAAALGLPLTQVGISPASSNAEYETAMAATLEDARRAGISRVAFGDLFLADIRAYREAQLSAVGMEALFPVWGRDTAAFARDFLALGFRAVVVCVDTTELDAAFCGRDLDGAFFDDLPARVDPCGERGEFHTFVHAGPPFARPVRFTHGTSVTRDDRFRFHDLLPAAGTDATGTDG